MTLATSGKYVTSSPTGTGGRNYTNVTRTLASDWLLHGLIKIWQLSATSDKNSPVKN